MRMKIRFKIEYENAEEFDKAVEFNAVLHPAKSPEQNAADCADKIREYFEDEIFITLHNLIEEK